MQFIIDVDFTLGSLHFVDASKVANVSKVRAASIFRVEVNRLKECSYMSCPHQINRRKGGVWYTEQ